MERKNRRLEKRYIKGRLSLLSSPFFTFHRFTSFRLKMRSYPAITSSLLLFASSISALPTSNLNPPIYKSLSPSSLETLSALVNQDHEKKPERPDVVPIAFFAYIFMLYFLCSLLRFRVWPMMVGSVKWNSFRSDIQKTMVSKESH